MVTRWIKFVFVLTRWHEIIPNPKLWVVPACYNCLVRFAGCDSGFNINRCRLSLNSYLNRHQQSNTSPNSREYHHNSSINWEQVLCGVNYRRKVMLSYVMYVALNVLYYFKSSLGLEAPCRCIMLDPWVLSFSRTGKYLNRALNRGHTSLSGSSVEMQCFWVSSFQFVIIFDLMWLCFTFVNCTNTNKTIASEKQNILVILLSCIKDWAWAAKRSYD